MDKKMKLFQQRVTVIEVGYVIREPFTDFKCARLQRVHDKL